MDTAIGMDFLATAYENYLVEKPVELTGMDIADRAGLLQALPNNLTNLSEVRSCATISFCPILWGERIVGQTRIATAAVIDGVSICVGKFEFVTKLTALFRLK
ncbi:protein of unknown function [Acidithiobacillus ferrivorans]|uniref:Uncharacterized protein n=1 Tax=Acidithiobacillus ferrivorans TaxID=160808 RepID=A0A060UV68_9PROT|nr:hypothetical protein [Acidithiobacillus ferrivorans]CDQ10678.1 hypothetical protein AFERRI_400459 [Acidithiobacillus ferrivorans]SMH64704.1 protein of unknown function [Acidithiobacillus ferrivorans]